jgi:hypothetical protein
MLWPALSALSNGDLSAEQLDRLRQNFRLDAGPRTEGPGAAGSIAHRAWTDEAGVQLLLDVARAGDSSWVFTLFYSGEQPSAETVEAHRALFRDAIDGLRLTLVEITPAATADEVFVASEEPAGTPSSAFAAHWELPGELDAVWFHLGVPADAPREVKEVKLRELTRTPAWASAPAGLRSEAEEFLGTAG